MSGKISVTEKDLAKTDIKTMKLIEHLSSLHDEYFEFYPAPEVPVIENVPTPLEFLRHYVSQNRPVLIKNAVTHYPAYEKWTNEYLKLKLQNKKVTVAVTPHGYADAIYKNSFVMPEERLMTFDDFLETLENPKSPVFYIQKQNNNLNEEFDCLLSDIDHHIPWATEAFAQKPDAANFWMGDERAVTSLHKDHYENIYCVLRGHKKIILHAPVDAPWIPYKNFNAAVWCNVNEMNDAHFEELDTKVKWIPVDPLDHCQTEHPLYHMAKAICTTVEAGDVLYIPSLWFHHVRQSHECIAVNYWYDMEFNNNYCQFKFLEDMGELIHSTFIK